MPAFWKTVFSGVGEEPSPEAVAAAGPAKTAATIIRQRTSVTRRSAFISMARTPRGVKTALRSYIDRPTVKGSDSGEGPRDRRFDKAVCSRVRQVTRVRRTGGPGVRASCAPIARTPPRCDLRLRDGRVR